jgi:hypothetical protein
MKKTYPLIILFFIALTIQAQELPNSGFESWENVGTYEEPTSWHTPNPFTSLIGAVTVTKSEDAFGGDYSAMLESINITIGSFSYDVPGLVTYADFNVDISTGAYTFKGGLFMPHQVLNFSGKYKYTGAEGDSASVIIYSFAHPEGEEMDTIGIGFGILHDAIDWTDFSVSMVQLNDHTPDTFNVLILSSGSEIIIPGSVLKVDDVTFETNVGVFSLPERNIEVSIFPNPATDRLTFETTENSAGRILRIFDITGREVKNIPFTNRKLSVDVSDLLGGHYSYIVQEKQELLGTGSFIKK